MPDREQIVKAIIGLIVMGLMFLICVGLYWYFIDPFYVPSRPILKTESISLLWTRKIKISNHIGYDFPFVTPNDQIIIFGDRTLASDSITALNLTTGKTMWEVELSDYRVMRLHNDKLFVTSGVRLNSLEEAPISNDQILPDCSFGGRASMLTYDPQTGEQLWGYVYQGVDSSDIFFENQIVYLAGSNDHGASRSIAQIDTNSGSLLHLECNEWPNEKEIMHPSENRGFDSEPFRYRKVYRERDLDRRDVLLFFAVEDNRLNILDGITKNIVGYAEFGGVGLSPRYFDIAVQNDIAVIYLRDSDQLFGFRISQMEELREAYKNRPKLEKDCDCD